MQKLYNVDMGESYMDAAHMILKWHGVEMVKVSDRNMEVYGPILCVCLEFFTSNWEEK